MRIALVQGIACFWVLMMDSSVAVGQESSAKDEEKFVLFDGKSLDGWKKTPFGGEGEIEVVDGQLVLGMGATLTGVTYDRKHPKMNYEISLEAKRSAGSDFFCGLTFPVNEESCSLIVGGWGGGLVGLSSLNGMDASENDTSSHQVLKNDRWYKIRVRVTPGRIEAWIDDDQVVDADVSDRKVGVRVEVEKCKPLGIATWRTEGMIRKVETVKLPGDEKGR